MAKPPASSVCLMGNARCKLLQMPMGFIPGALSLFFCILHPLDLDDKGRITLDSLENMMSEAGSCVRPADAAQPLLDTFEPELRYLMGENIYAALKELAEENTPPPSALRLD